ncbi:unnamed protein product [Linum tenue]|uniref:Uncharacterized protein n=1 Tax=Linum tenue TaxID=586396 RepID=A0AAV0QYB1_9ROSI|nr:unnamed protein product [Linum tenue]
MAMATLAAARRVAALGRVSSPATSVQAASLVPRRGLAGAADHHGPPKVNCWSQPTNPAQWKEEHFVIVSLTGWALLIGGSYKFFTKGKKEEVTLLLPSNVRVDLVFYNVGVDVDLKATFFFSL